MKTLFKRSSSGKLTEWTIELEGSQYRTHTGQAGGKITTSKWTQCVAKHVGKSNEQTPQQTAIMEVAAKIKKKREDGHFDDISDVDGERRFEPMLAYKWNDHSQKYINKVIASQPKLDGIRCNPIGNQLMSRTGKPIVSCPHIIEQLSYIQNDLIAAFGENFTLDGELYNHDFKSDFEEIVSIVRTQKPTAEDLDKSSRLMQYHIYDIDVPGWNFESRIKRLTEVIVTFNVPNIFIVPTVVFANNRSDIDSELDKLYGEYLVQGYEGQMLRDAVSLYENKRSYNLLKRKEFIDEECKIIDIIEGTGNRSGMLGNFVCEFANGIRFDAGARGTHQYWTELFVNKHLYIGKSATIRYQNLTGAGKPRFPVITKVAREDYE